MSGSFVPDWAWFAGSTVFAVLALELYRVWSAKRPLAPKFSAVEWVGAALGVVFAVMVAAGALDYFVVHKATFYNLSLFLSGAAGLGVLLDLVIKRRRGDPDELRKMLAHDL
jgi:hypothetical protein